jgi:hypothetical protein
MNYASQIVTEKRLSAKEKQVGFLVATGQGPALILSMPSLASLNRRVLQDFIGVIVGGLCCSPRKGRILLKYLLKI